MVNVTEFKSASELLLEIEVCDIVEFNRGHYSHFGFYIGDGICLNVTGPEKDSRTTWGEKFADTLYNIAEGGLVRINNQEVKAFFYGAATRPVNQALNLAKKDLVDTNGNLIPGRRVRVKYALTSFYNCEAYATYWKYNDTTGWSQQAMNELHCPLGFMERELGKVESELIRVMKDDDEPTASRITAFAAAVYLTPIKVTVTALKRTTDCAAVVFAAPFMITKKLFTIVCRDLKD